MASESRFLLHALYLGVFLTFVYDLLRIFRRVVPHRRFFVSAEDLLFWIYCGGEVFLLLYFESNGEFRWFAIWGALTGMLLYRRLVSPFLVTYVSRALNGICRFLWNILRRLCRPVGHMCKTAAGGAGRVKRKTGRTFRRVIRGAKNRLTYFLKTLKMTIKA